MYMQSGFYSCQSQACMFDDLLPISHHRTLISTMLQKAVRPHTGTRISCHPLLLNPASHEADESNGWLGLLFGSLNKKQFK